MTLFFKFWIRPSLKRKLKKNLMNFSIWLFYFLLSNQVDRKNVNWNLKFVLFYFLVGGYKLYLENCMQLRILFIFSAFFPHTHTHTHIYTYAYTYSHTHIYKDTLTYTHKPYTQNTKTYTHMHTHTYLYIYTH